jgi:hypothetical protein
VVDSYQSEEDRPLKQPMTPTTDQNEDEERFTVQVDFQEISQTWANQVNSTTRSNLASENNESHRYSAKQNPDSSVNKLV